MELEKLGPNDAPYTWEDFKRIFYERYFPQSIRFQKFREFDRLEQGSMTVAQYAMKFEELSRYAPTLIADERVRARKFENGLRGRIQQQVTAFEMPTYKGVVNKALVIERGLDIAQAEREKVLKKRSRSGDHQGQDDKNNNTKSPKFNNNTLKDEIIQKDDIRCYKCGGPHLKRDCT